MTCCHALLLCCCCCCCTGTAAASRHHFLVVDLQDGVPHCAADVWVQTAPDATSSTSSSSNGQDSSFLASTAAAMHAVQHSKSKTKTAKQAAAKAAQEECLRRLRLQAPQQLQLAPTQQAQLFGGFQVHVAEVYEVLRTLQPGSDAAAAGDGAAAAAAAAYDGSRATEQNGAGAGSQGGPVWQYFDAFVGKWVSAPCPSPPVCADADVPLGGGCTAALSQ